MKPYILILIILATEITGRVFAEPIQIDGGKITFEAPSGFSPLNAEEISLKYPSSRAPRFVLGNETRATTIAYDIKPHPITEDQLANAQGSFKQTFDRVVPGIEWKENKIIEKNGKKWIYFEMTSRAIDQDIYNIMLITPYNGHLLMFNFNSTKKEFPDYEKALRESIESIRFKE